MTIILKENQKRTTSSLLPLKILLGIIFLVILVLFGRLLWRDWQSTQITVAENSFGSNEAGRIGDLSISMEEFMLYSVEVKNGYEEQYGKNIWSTVTENALGKEATFEEIAKEDTFEEIRLVKALCLKSIDDQITISEEEAEVISENALDYYEDLLNANAATPQMTYELVYQYYYENYLANKVYSKYKEDVESMDNEQYLEFWSNILKTYYPNFDYYTDINWELINELHFEDTEK